MGDLDRILKMTKEIVSIDSRIGKEKELALYLLDELNALGLKTELIGDKRPNLYAFHTFSDQKNTFVLNGHIDTVEPADGWDYPFNPVQKGDWLYGLGAADMKAGIACIIEATKKMLDMDLKGTLALSFVSDEEGHGTGAKKMMEHPILKQANSILITEPFFGDENAGIPLGMTGKVLYKITVYGKKAHAFRPDEGINAIEDAAEIISAIKKTTEHEKFGNFKLPFDPEFGKASFCPLKIEGGYKVYNVSVPEECSIILNRLTLPNEDRETVIEDLNFLIRSLNLRSKVKIDLIPPFYKSYKLQNDHQLVISLSNAYSEIMGKEPSFSYEPMITDANIFMGEYGIPTLVFGPLGKDLHSKDERVFVPSLVPTTNIISRYVISCIS